MNFQSKNFDLPENVFFFYNSELQFLSFVLDWDTSDKFYDNLLNVSKKCIYFTLVMIIKFLFLLVLLLFIIGIIFMGNKISFKQGHI